MARRGPARQGKGNGPGETSWTVSVSPAKLLVMDPEDEIDAMPVEEQAPPIKDPNDYEAQQSRFPEEWQW